MEKIYSDYETLLIGKTTTIAPYNFYKASERGANSRISISCIRYAIEELLGWTVEEAELKFDEYIIHLMHMEQLVDNLIFPPEVPYGDPKYILHLLYPRIIRYDFNKSVEDVLLSVLNKEGSFPREFFLGEGGFYRYTVCLSYVLNNFMSFDSTPEIYEFILSARGRRFLSRMRLWVPADQMGIDLLECIYVATKDDDEDAYFYYCFYQFQSEYEEFIYDNDEQPEI